MDQFVNSHLYLVSLLIWLCIFLIGLLLLKKNIISVIIAGILALPQALFGILLVPIYWNPDRIMITVFGIEDLIFCFLAGGIVWISALIILKEKIVIDYKFKRFILRFLFCTAFGFGVVTVLYFCGIRNKMNAYITMVLWFITIVIVKREYFYPFLKTAFLFLIIYTVDLKLAFTIWPDLMSFWSWDKISGVTIWGMPLEELIWALLYGGSWSIAVAFFLDVKIRKPLKTTKL